MITRIKIDGFKSFSDFEVELKPFNVIVGANGSGKSNLLDALYLLRSLTEGSIAEAFSKQRGTPSELFTRYPDGTTAQEMSFEVDVFDYATIHYYKKQENFYSCLRLKYAFTLAKTESAITVKKEYLSTIPIEKDTWIDKHLNSEYKDSWLYHRLKEDKIYLNYTSDDSSYSLAIINYLLSIEQDNPDNNLIYRMIKGSFQNWSFLDLNPQKLRLPSSKYGAEQLQEDGSNLAATLKRIVKNNPEYLGYISSTLTNLLPAYKEVKVVHDDIQEMYYIAVQDNSDTWFNARLLSEGTLKMLALVVLQFDDKHKGTLCLEEPENGVHPFRIKAILELLQELCTDLSSPPEKGTQLKQTILTTHSPVLLSRALELEGEVALFYSDIVTSASPSRSFPIKATRLYPIYQEDTNPSKITLNIGEKRIYAKQVVDYLHSADLEQ